MIAWLIETTIAVTFLMLVVLAVRGPVAHFFGAGWAYALWALPALRLVLPPLHLLGDAFPSLFPAKVAASARPAAAPMVMESVTAFSWEPLMLGAWLAGAAAIVLWQSWRYLAFIRRLGIGSHIHASLSQEIGVIESAEVEGPLAIGLLDRWIVVPADFTTRYTPQEQRLALQHERTHHGREDIFWNMIALGLLALNWFNPVAYIAFRAFRTDQELSCDAAVAAQASSGERHHYALALVKSASRPGLIAACPLNHAGQLKHRLKMMKAHRRSRLRALGGSGAVAALLLTGISVTESASIAAPEAALPAPAPAAPPLVVSAPRPAAAPVASAAPESRPRRTAAKAKAAAPVANKPVRLAAAAPRAQALPAQPEADAPPPPPARILVVRLEGRDGLAPPVPHQLSGREFQLVRTHIRTARELDPDVKARLETLLAARTGEASRVQLITINHQ